MSGETYDLLDKTLISGEYKTASEAISHVLTESNDFIDMEDVGRMLDVANKQYKNGRTIKLFQ